MTVETLTFDLGGSPFSSVRLVESDGLAPLQLPVPPESSVHRFQTAMDAMEDNECLRGLADARRAAEVLVSRGDAEARREPTVFNPVNLESPVKGTPVDDAAGRRISLEGTLRDVTTEVGSRVPRDREGMTVVETREPAAVFNPVNLESPVEETPVDDAAGRRVSLEGTPVDDAAEVIVSRGDAEARREPAAANPVNLVSPVKETPVDDAAGRRISLEGTPRDDAAGRRISLEGTPRDVTTEVGSRVPRDREGMTVVETREPAAVNPVNLESPVKETPVDDAAGRRVSLEGTPVDDAAEVLVSRRDAEARREPAAVFNPVNLESPVKETPVDDAAGRRISLEGTPVDDAAEVLVSRGGAETRREPAVFNPVNLESPVKETPVDDAAGRRISLEGTPRDVTTEVGSRVPRDREGMTVVETREPAAVVLDPDEAVPQALPAAPAAQVAAVADMPAVPSVAAVQSARTEAIVETVGKAVEIIDKIVDAVVSEISVTPSLYRGEGEVRIVLKPTVLDGSEIKLEAKAGELTVSISPATAESAQIVQHHLPRLETALAEHVPAFRSVAVVISSAKKGRSDETV